MTKFLQNLLHTVCIVAMQVVATHNKKATELKYPVSELLQAVAFLLIASKFYQIKSFIKLKCLTPNLSCIECLMISFCFHYFRLL